MSEDEIIALCAERLGSYKNPVAVKITREPLLKSPVGNIRRKVRRNLHWVGRDRKVGGSQSAPIDAADTTMWSPV